MKNIFVKNGQKYLRIGDKAIPFNRYDDAGRPVIDPKVETTIHKDGRKSVTVKIPCLRIKHKTHG